MSSQLASLRADLSKFVDDVGGDKMKHVAGDAAKKAALDAAERDLGSDRAFSGMRRKAKLGAGYELESGPGLTLNLSPKGLWMLANDGRRGGAGRIYPKKRGRRGRTATLSTPWGPRASVKSSRSRGLGTLADAERAVETETFKAVDKAVTDTIARF